LLVTDLLEEWPEDADDLATLKQFVLGNPSYRNLLISEDGRITTVAIKTSSFSSVASDELADLDAAFEDGEDEAPVYLTDDENSEAVAAVRRIAEDFRSTDFPIAIAGAPVITHEVKNGMRTDMPNFIRLTLLSIAVFLFILFRRVSAVLLPLAVVILSLACTIGLMTASGTSLQLPTMILPSFLLAVGVCDSVHILTLFFRKFNAGGSKEASIVYALEHCGIAVVLTSLTTAGGLLSFAGTALAPISNLGIFAPVGVMIAMVASVVLLPALLAVVPLRARAPVIPPVDSRPKALDRFIASAGDFASTRPVVVVTVSAVLVAMGLAGVAQIDFSHEPLKWLPESSPARQAAEMIDRDLKGSITLEVVLDKHRENAWYSPDALTKLERFSRYAESFESGDLFIGRAFSLVDVTKEIHKALNENRPEFYVVPGERELVAQELLLFENSGTDDLEDLTDSQFSKVRVTLKAPFVSAQAYASLIGDFERRLSEQFGADTDVALTGLMPLLFRTMSGVMTSMARSYGIAVVVISVLMVLLLGSVRLGLLSMIPNLVPILLTLGLMGWAGLPLDTFTLLIGSIALGLVVDDTIHFMHNYRRYYEETGDSRRATQLTLAIAGQAMLYTTLMLATGFFVFVFASMNNLISFGLLTALAIVLALLADFLLAPALMQLIHGGQERER
jgi:predicted RND superfamily exporter protein